MFGDFDGGALLIQEPNGIRRIEEKDMWFTFNGKRDLHWNEKILNGTKYSIICFVRDNIKKTPIPDRNKYKNTLWDFWFSNKEAYVL